MARDERDEFPTPPLLYLTVHWANESNDRAFQFMCCVLFTPIFVKKTLIIHDTPCIIHDNPLESMLTVKPNSFDPYDRAPCLPSRGPPTGPRPTPVVTPGSYRWLQISR